MKSDKLFTRALRGTSLVAALALWGLGAQPASAMTLEEAVRLSLQTNPDVAIAEDGREIAVRELRQARGLYLPQVDLTGAYGRERITNSSTRAQTGGARSLTRTEGSVIGTQRLFDGFDAGSQVDRQSALLDAAALRLNETSEFVGLDAVNAFLEVVRQRELLRLAEENVQSHMDILSLLQDRSEAGTASIAEVRQTESRLARTRATLEERRNELRDTEAFFARVVGQAPESLEIPAVPMDAIPADMQQTYDTLRTANPTVRIFDAEIRAADANVRNAESSYYPHVNFEVSHNYRDGVDGLETYERSSQALVRLTWNLYRGGIDRAARQEALMRRNEARNLERQALLNAREQLDQSWNALEAAQRRIAHYREASEAATLTRDIYFEQFSVGQRTLLDLLDSENELFVAAGNLETAQNNLMFAHYRVLAVLGNMLATLGVEPPAGVTEEQESFWASITASE